MAVFRFQYKNLYEFIENFIHSLTYHRLHNCTFFFYDCYNNREKQRSIPIRNTILIAEFAQLYNNLVMVVKCRSYE